MQILIGLLLSMQLHTPMMINSHPNGELFTQIECECGDWYIPKDFEDTTCYCCQEGVE